VATVPCPPLPNVLCATQYLKLQLPRPLDLLAASSSSSRFIAYPNPIYISTAALILPIPSSRHNQTYPDN
jgi:hypothetical protein